MSTKEDQGSEKGDENDESLKKSSSMVEMETKVEGGEGGERKGFLCGVEQAEADHLAVPKRRSGHVRSLSHSGSKVTRHLLSLSSLSPSLPPSLSLSLPSDLSFSPSCSISSGGRSLPTPQHVPPSRLLLLLRTRPRALSPPLSPLSHSSLPRPHLPCRPFIPQGDMVLE
jgi:hypothetical protein